MQDNRTLYEKKVQDRSQLRYFIGLIVRWKQNFKYARARRIARKRGAIIGEGVIMPISLAKKVNKNVTIGNHVYPYILTIFLLSDSPSKLGIMLLLGIM